MSDDRQWKLKWDETDTYVLFKEVDEQGRVHMEFALEVPRYAKLYYALKDWFQD